MEKTFFFKGATKRFRGARRTGDKATEAHSPGSTESSAEGRDIVALDTQDGKANCVRVEVVSCCERERRLCYITPKHFEVGGAKEKQRKGGGYFIIPVHCSFFCFAPIG